MIGKDNDNMTMNLFWMCAIGIVAAMAGFWSGRLSLLLGSREEEPLLETGTQNIEAERLAGTEEISDEGVDAQNIRAEGLFGLEKMKKIAMKRTADTRISEIATRQSEQKSVIENKKKEYGMTKSNENNKENWQNRFWLPRRRLNNEKRIPLGWAIGSPAEGAVRIFNNGSIKGAMVRTTKGCLYAPASGKIVKLYPSGNQMMLRTDFGIELLIRIGGINVGYQAEQEDDMVGEYFRPRVLQNEIVNKGKLLLEYDREALLAAGADTDIFIGVEEAGNFRDITVTDKTQVGQGEEILWVVDHSRIVTNDSW